MRVGMELAVRPTGIPYGNMRVGMELAVRPTGIPKLFPTYDDKINCLCFECCLSMKKCIWPISK